MLNSILAQYTGSKKEFKVGPNVGRVIFHYSFFLVSFSLLSFDEEHYLSLLSKSSPPSLLYELLIKLLAGLSSIPIIHFVYSPAAGAVN